MKHRERIEEKLQKTGHTVGCYDKRVDQLSEESFAKVLEQADYGSCDVQIQFNNEPYVVEIYHVDEEVDFGLISASDYAKQYGRAVGE